MTANYYLSTAARALLLRIAEDEEGPFSMVIANGCCDGTAPYLYRDMVPEPHWQLVLQDDLVSVYTGTLGPDAPGMDVLIDALPAMSDSFSLESDYGYRFVVRLLATS
ncbi:DUF779 domain-containing protein [Alicyclobacillus curvatus]|jgi:uncharacterized protein (DUF779 family)|nr:DUF779 domain-containing protein [Alicyclobacillus curvatus]